MTSASTALELAQQPREVQYLYRQASLPASIIPKALQVTQKDTADQRAQKEADRLMWALTAHSLGLDIGTAVKHVAVISGAPVVSAEMARRVAMAQGCELEIVKADDQGATVRGRRGRGEWSVVSFTRRDAERAGFYDVTWETGWGQTSQKWPERWFDIVEERMVMADESTRPKWAQPSNKDGRRKFREAYFRWPTAMFLARASTLLTRMIAPVATIAGTLLRIDEELDAMATSEAVAVEDAIAARADTDDDIIDGEIVDREDHDVPVTAPQLAESWTILWRAACESKGANKATSAALIRYATSGAASASADVPEGDRRACTEALALWSTGGLRIVDGEVVEDEAVAS